MTAQKYCGVEGERFPVTNFATNDDGIVIHVVTDKRGHTLDGWPATYKIVGQLYDDFKITDISIEEMSVADLGEMNLDSRDQKGD